MTALSGLPASELMFADSALEGDGFEPRVPQKENHVILTFHLTAFGADPKSKLWSTSQEGA